VARGGPELGKEINIGEDCWLGGNVVVLLARRDHWEGRDGWRGECGYQGK